MLSLDANLPSPTICPASPCPAGYPDGALYYPAGVALANNAVWNTTHWFSEGISSYNGLEVDVNHRWSRSLQFRGAYTFSKSLDDGEQHEHERRDEFSRVRCEVLYIQMPTTAALGSM